jgi:CRP-like cAMP-binding protein
VWPRSGRVRIIPAPARKVDPIPSITPGPTSVDAAVQKRLSRLQPHPGGRTSSKEILQNKSYAESITGSDATPAKHLPASSGDPASSLSGHHSGTHAAGGPGVYEVRRGDTIGEGALLAETAHDPTAVCVRDTEMVRMSRAAFQFICSKSPSAAARLLEVRSYPRDEHLCPPHRPLSLVSVPRLNLLCRHSPVLFPFQVMARKLRRKDRGGANRQDMVTIALLPGSGLGVRSVQRVAVQLEQVGVGILSGGWLCGAGCV